MTFRLVRGATIIATALAVGVILSGCSIVSTVVAHTSLPPLKPAAGDCWTATLKTAQDTTSWSNGGTVPCSLSHQLYTFGVTSIHSSASTWKGEGGDLDQGIWSEAYDACNQEFVNFMPSDVASGTRLEEFFFLPSESAWKKGARWVRCDLAVARIGSLFNSPTLAALPSKISTLLKGAKATPELFNDCVTTTDSSGNTGPYDDPLATIADCTKNYQWRYDGYFRIPEDAGAPCPTDAEAQKFLQQQCGDAAEADGLRWVGYVPNQDDWASGNRFGSCWVSMSQVPQT